MKKHIQYSVQAFLDKKVFNGLPPTYRYNTWGGGSDFDTFKAAKKLYDDISRDHPEVEYRMISNQGFVRFRSRK